MSNEIIYNVGADGSITGRRNFSGGTIAMMRLQFSSNRGVAFCVNAERTPQAVIYYER
jgi:hypothetical protein